MCANTCAHNLHFDGTRVTQSERESVCLCLSFRMSQEFSKNINYVTLQPTNQAGLLAPLHLDTPAVDRSASSCPTNSNGNKRVELGNVLTCGLCHPNQPFCARAIKGIIRRLKRYFTDTLSRKVKAFYLHGS